MSKFGKELVDGFDGFRNALQLNNGVVPAEYTCRRVVLNLETQPFPPKRVKETRAVLSVSQGVFAQFIGVSAKCVQSWEQGRQQVPPIACRFMDEIHRNPQYWKQRLEESIQAVV